MIYFWMKETGFLLPLIQYYQRHIIYNGINPASAFSIGAVSNSEEERLHANNDCSPIFFCLSIGATSSKDDVVYEFIFWKKTNKYKRLIRTAAAVHTVNNDNPTSAFSIRVARHSREDR